MPAVHSISYVSADVPALLPACIMQLQVNTDLVLQSAKEHAGLPSNAILQVHMHIYSLFVGVGLLSASL
jgi:hypothetical protein